MNLNRMMVETQRYPNRDKQRLSCWRNGLLVLVLLNISGCMSPLALDKAVIAYDKTTTDILSKQLLLNIARAHQHQPMHFTGVSNIAATFNFQFNAGATPALSGNNGALLTPVFGGTLSESPTISIVPIEGEEFTRRLLAPLQEHKLTMLLRQGADVDLILRLIAGELRMYDHAETGVFRNKPADSEGYRVFRQAVLHLSSIQDRGQLFIEPLQFTRRWQLPVESLSAEQLAALQDEFTVDYQAGAKQVTLSKRMVGHTVLTNYDPATLTHEQRQQLNDEAEKGAMNDLAVDIRPGYPGGEWPIHGFLRLRSFHNVLNFIGQALGDEPEYSVEKHPKTPAVRENPVMTMGVAVSQTEPDGDELNVCLGDQYYALQQENGHQWNREGFRLLYQLFQMTMTDLAQQGAPSITISK